MRRILPRLQGAQRGASFDYETLCATKQTGQKTSKMAPLMIYNALSPTYALQRVVGRIIVFQIDRAIGMAFDLGDAGVHRFQALTLQLVGR